MSDDSRKKKKNAGKQGNDYPGYYGQGNQTPYGGEEFYGNQGRGEIPYGQSYAGQGREEAPYGSQGYAGQDREEAPYGSRGYAGQGREEAPYGSQGYAGQGREEAPYGSRGYAGQSRGEAPYGSQGYAGQGREEAPYGSQGYAGQSRGEAPYGGQGYAGQGRGEAPYSGQGYGGAPRYGNPPYGGQGYGEPPYGNPAYGEGPYGGQSYYGQGGQPPYGPGGGYYSDEEPDEPFRGLPGGDYVGRSSGKNTHTPKQTKKPKKKKKRSKILFALEIIVLLVLALFLVAMVRLNRMGRLSLDESSLHLDAAVTDSLSGYRNIAFFGVDSREGDLVSDCRSDTIIVCSINKKTKGIKLVSVYRDTYLDNTDGSYRKATECYQYGGPERSVAMLNKNLDLNITDYVTVDFNAIVKAVDLIGGIELEVTEEELDWLNGYCVENSQVTGVGYTPLTSAGYQHLDGIQALAYCRIRYTDGWDFKRTERQREVLGKIFAKAQSSGVTQLLAMVDQMLPYISTSLSTTEMIALASDIAAYSLEDSVGFPFDQVAMDISVGDCVIPVNLANNVTQLHARLFGTEGYTPSAAVQEISNKIIEDTGVQ